MLCENRNVCLSKESNMIHSNINKENHGLVEGQYVIPKCLYKISIYFCTTKQTLSSYKTSMQGHKFPPPDPRQLQAWEYDQYGITNLGLRLSLEVCLTEAVFNDAAM